MASTARILMYATRFEETYADDNWERLEEFFTEDACYEDAVGRANGRAAVLDYMRNSVDRIDRTFDERVLQATGQLRCGDDWVEFDYSVIYRKAGRRDLAIQGVHRAEFQDDRIRRLVVTVD